jgi:Periplasmic binding protein
VQFIPHLVYRTGAYAPNGIPVANGVADYYRLINERDGGINGVKLVVEECDRLRHRPRRGMLRAAEGQRPNRRRLCISTLDRITFALTEKGAARQDSAHHPGLRPLGVARRLAVPVELPATRHLLDGGRHHPAAHRQEGRRVRQAQGQEDRARLS